MKAVDSSVSARMAGFPAVSITSTGPLVIFIQAAHAGGMKARPKRRPPCRASFLGANLVLIDTPGLHSGTEDHAALTRRFTDSA